MFFHFGASESYHHGGVLIEGGFGLCRLGAEGWVTAASHQQGSVCRKYKDTHLICAGSFGLYGAEAEMCVFIKYICRHWITTVLQTLNQPLFFFFHCQVTAGGIWWYIKKHRINSSFFSWKITSASAILITPNIKMLFHVLFLCLFSDLIHIKSAVFIYAVFFFFQFPLLKTRGAWLSVSPIWHSETTSYQTVNGTRDITAGKRTPKTRKESCKICENRESLHLRTHAHKHTHTYTDTHNCDGVHSVPNHTLLWQQCGNTSEMEREKEKKQSSEIWGAERWTDKDK